MEKLKVSVIVPVYNVEKYLEKCLDSLVNQTLKEIEIIIVNDGTKDNSQSIIDRYQDQYSSIIKSHIKSNGGLSSARNFGLSQAVGEYIAFIDSDDYIELNMLEKMYEIAKKNNCDIVSCNILEHNEEKLVYHNYFEEQDLLLNSTSVCNKIFKKKCIKDFSFMENVWYEDLNFLLKIMLEKINVFKIEDYFYHYIIHDNSAIHNNNSVKNLDIIKVIEDVKKYADKKSTACIYLINEVIYNHVLITTINRVNDHKNTDKKIVLKTLKEYCHEMIPNYKREKYYQSSSFNRKLIANLNYHGLWSISKLIFKIKRLIKE